MSTEYTHWLIPHQPTLRPPAEALVALAAALVGDGWAVPTGVVLRPRVGPKERWRSPISGPLSPDVFRDDDASDVRVTLTMPENTVRDPFVRDPIAFGGLHTTLGFDRAGRDLGYVHRDFERLDELGDVRCACGEDLGFEVDDVSPLAEPRIHTRCPACGLPFDVRTIVVRAHDVWRPGISREVPGGATSCFAIWLYTGEEYPIDDAHPVPTVAPGLRELCEGVLGCALREVSEPNC